MNFRSFRDTVREDWKLTKHVSRGFVVLIVVLLLVLPNVYATYDIKVIDPPAVPAGTHTIDVAPGEFYELKFTIEYKVEGLTKISANIYPDVEDSDLWEYAHFETRVDKSGEMTITLDSKAPLEKGTYAKDLIVTTGVPDNRKSFKYTFSLNVISETKLPETQLTKDSTYDDFFPKWSPDNKWIVYTRIGDNDLANIWKMKADGTSNQPLTSGDSSHTMGYWASDDKIYFSSDSGKELGDKDLWRMNSDGRSKEVIVSTDEVEYWPILSPDESKILYKTRTGRDTYTIWTMNVDGTNRRKLTGDDAGYNTLGDWSPDGKWVVFSSKRTGDMEVFKINVDTKETERLTNNPTTDGWPVWSPDGKKIAFQSDRAGNLDIWMMDPDGSNLLQLTTHQANDRSWSWSPDGTKIAFESDRDGGDTDIFVLDVSSIVSPKKPRIVVLANSIDFELASEFFGFLGNKGMETVHATASDFEQYKDEKFIVILGGPDAYGGIGEIVQEILTEDEQSAIREKGKRKKYTKINPWKLRPGQRITILAGSDRNQTKKSHEENKEEVSTAAEN